MKYLAFSLILLGNSLALFAQSNQKLGEWRSYLPYTQGYYVTQTPSEIWYTADRSILIIDKEELSQIKFDKLDGLTDVGLKMLKYSAGNEVVVAVYENSNIDLITVDRKKVTNIGDIKRNIELQGDKSIYDIIFYKKYAFLATGFGIVQLNIDRAEIASTINTGLKVNTVTIHQEHIYAATNEGIFFAPLNDTFNLQDFGQWEKLDTEEGFPDDYTSRIVHHYKEKLYLDVHDSLFVYDNNNLEYIIHKTDFVPHYATDGQQKLIVQFQQMPYYGQYFYTINEQGVLDSLTYPNWCLSGSGRAIVEDEQGRFWVGDRGGKYRLIDGETGDCSYMTTNTAVSVSNSKIALYNDEIWITAGGIKQNWGYEANPNGVSAFINGEWKNYNQSSTDVLSNVYDMVGIAINPKNGQVFIGSYMRGLIVYDRNEFKVFNETNSPLQGAETEQNVRVPGVALDEKGNVWLSNMKVTTPIVLYQADGTWKTFPISGVRDLAHVTIDDAGNKWFTTSGKGVVVFHEGEDIDNHADNKYRHITASNSLLPTNDVYTIAKDQEGDVWVGTSEGIIIFECGNNAYNANCRGTRRIVKREDGNNAYLLKTEVVRTIAVDGANRKWVGTTNGVFLLSPDGTEEIFHFTENNSPLFDNIINDITINEKTGEVVIGTKDGVLSYMGDATEGNFRHNKEVYAFPNPVAPDYDAPIAIRGLAENATVKITDIRGQLVFQTQAKGGQAIWNGKDYNGRRAAAGVYLVFSVNEKNLNNPDGYVTKILMMR